MNLPLCQRVFVIVTFILGLFLIFFILHILHTPYQGYYQMVPMNKHNTSGTTEMDKRRHLVSTVAPQQKATMKVLNCDSCKKVLDEVEKHYSPPWKMQEDNHQKFTSQLNTKCNGLEAVITQNNTALNSVITFSEESKSKADVTPDLFDLFAKEHIFTSEKLETCSVVGNGGILIDSKCGKDIDSAQFVFRCNLPPLDNSSETHVGQKTNFVSANPSIFYIKFSALKEKKKLVDALKVYGSSYLLLAPFILRYSTEISIKAAKILKEFQSPIRPIFLNPTYLKNLESFWRKLGLKENRLSTGLMMVSLALEVCEKVDLYGFWPFEFHPQKFNALTNHYYDNVPADKAYHAMSSEFGYLLRLHSEGVLRIHLEDCQPGDE